MPEPPPIWSDAFLAEEIRDQPEYKALVEDSAAFDAFVETARDLLGKFRAISEPDEQLTIERVITPLLGTLGWPSPVAKRRLTPRDEVDLVLHADEAQRELSLGGAQRDQVLSADGLVECKPWGSPFDTSGSGSRPGETAAQQIQRYLLIAGTDSNASLCWGILTNGARWRVYSYRARPRDRAWEVDLAQLLVSEDLFSQVLTDAAVHQLRLAWLLLRRDSWVPAAGERESFLDRILEAGRRRDAKVADDLSNVIFDHVYPDLVRLFWSKQPDAEPDIVARAALTFLYRLLFIYYAEDRGMLDTENHGYRSHSLRYSVRDPIAEQHGASRFSTVSTQFWQRLKTLRTIIDRGDNSIDQPAYNGGLFAAHQPILDEIELSDAELAPIIHQLSHTADGTYISYRSLEVQQLGSIYERLLERVPQRDDDGDIRIIPSPYARKDSGSYYTPQELVDLIVEQTLTPLVKERIAAFRDDPSEANDPATALLNLRILDPAMGSGHFLITALDWLTARIVELLDPDWEEAPGYISPVAEEVERHRAFDRTPLHESIRGTIRDRIEERRAVTGQFDPPSTETVIQRMVLKRCIYGVDKNDMAVELAKVALWLHTFAPPLPLPYIEHRIRTGDSLLGVTVATASDYLAEWGPGHIARGIWADYGSLCQTSEIDETALNDALDFTIEGTRESSQHHRNLTRIWAGLRVAFDLIAGLRWLSAGMTKRDSRDFHAPLSEALDGHVGRADAILHTGENGHGLTPPTPEFRAIRDRAHEIVQHENIVHWQLAFPHVMAGEDGQARGFDAIVTNPPWDRIEQQEKEWFANRRPEIAALEPASRRKAAIERGIANGDPLCLQYAEARDAAAAMRQVCRTSGDYPLLSGGRTNFYSLFVERSLALLNPQGIAGLLTPSGIYSDKTAAEFFRSVSTAGRIAGIYDFENRRSANPDASTARWFSEVHPQFKFCATIFAGAERRFDETECGFYLDGKADLQNADRVFPLAPDDFARINPNTGTAPTLRTATEADILKSIYRQHPVLVKHVNGEEDKAYPVRFTQGLFNMTSDSALFRTAEQIEAEGGYPVVGHRYQRGSEQWAPLYQGRMIHHFDHRASAVDFNPDSQDNPYVSGEVIDEQKQDPAFFPGVQYWVSVGEIESLLSSAQRWVVAFRDITNSTNERTMIATIAPWSAFGNQTPLLLPDPTLNAGNAALLVANLSSLALDFVAKRKVQGTHVNWFIVEQLPVIAPADYGRKFGETTAGDLVHDHVLRLSYTAHDLAPFAHDLGYDGEPFRWDPEERRQLRARLDALYFHLYGLDEEDTAYILDQFPVLEKNERKAHNRYQTKELVLAYHRALAAGDTTNTITLPPTPPDS